MSLSSAATLKEITTVSSRNSVKKINDTSIHNGTTASYIFDDIIGESKGLKKAITLGKKFAISRENILLMGESGTGKELFAQSIHNIYSPYGPFMAINCAAMPRSLIESELFGYEAGSFTGAESGGRAGKIEIANGGTLFLDEIGDMPLELQAIFLRVLEDKQIMRVGGRRYKKVDFRLIAATNKNLYKMVQEKTFREDLYFRLSVLPIYLPPLREREDDVELLSEHFIKNYCEKAGRNVPKVNIAAMKEIKNYEWPGNVRQLKNAMAYAVNVSQNEMIYPDDLPSIVWGQNPFVSVGGGLIEAEKVHSLKAMEKVVIRNTLNKTRNNIAKASEILGVGKSTIYRKIKEYEINVGD